MVSLLCCQLPFLHSGSPGVCYKDGSITIEVIYNDLCCNGAPCCWATVLAIIFVKGI